jgi:hypothetical protein
MVKVKIILIGLYYDYLVNYIMLSTFQSNKMLGTLKG